MAAPQIFALAARARAAICDGDRHRVEQFGQAYAMTGIAWAPEHRLKLRAVHVDRAGNFGSVVAAHPGFDLELDTAALAQQAPRLLVRRDDAGKATDFRNHVRQRGPFVRRSGRQGFTAIFKHPADSAALSVRVAPLVRV